MSTYNVTCESNDCELRMLMIVNESKWSILFFNVNAITLLLCSCVTNLDSRLNFNRFYLCKFFKNNYIAYFNWLAPFLNKYLLRWLFHWMSFSDDHNTKDCDNWIRTAAILFFIYFLFYDNTLFIYRSKNILYPIPFITFKLNKWLLFGKIRIHNWFTWIYIILIQ